MKVHAVLGNGFQEVIYQRALELEMAFEGLVFEREKEMPIYYREEEIGTRRVDFFVEGLIMVELKAIIELEPVFTWLRVLIILKLIIWKSVYS
jgi:GxxExxY protein